MGLCFYPLFHAEIKVMPTSDVMDDYFLQLNHCLVSCTVDEYGYSLCILPRREGARLRHDQVTDHGGMYTSCAPNQCLYNDRKCR